MKPKFRKGAFATYEVANGEKVLAVVRRAHRDGSVTVETRHRLNRDGEPCGCYLGYRFTLPVTLLTENV